MSRFVPARIIGDSIVAELEPFLFGALVSFRGVEVTLHPPDPAGGLYRSMPMQSTRRVVVREPHSFIEGEEHFLELFRDLVGEYKLLDGTPAPQLLHVYGAHNVPRAMVLEHVEGVSLSELLSALRERGEQLSVPLALAVAHELVDLWKLPSDRLRSPVRINLTLDDVLVSPTGKVRAKPELVSEVARQRVGAAVGVIAANFSFLTPEQFFGERITDQTGMYVVGLLLYVLLAGEHPVATPGISMFELMKKMRSEPLPPIQERRALLDEVAGFVHRATALDPSNRFATWNELSSCLAAVRSRFAPTTKQDLMTAIPNDVRPSSAPPINPAELGDWRNLPHSGYDRIEVRAMAPQQPKTRVVAVADPLYVYAGNDGRPMYEHGRLLVDVRPVTAAEYARFALATGMPAGRSPGDEPKTMVSFEEAESYARWAGKRLPDNDEWNALTESIGAARLGTGEVWEWTTTPGPHGRIVRGGRWRDQWERPPSPDNLSFETGPAVDLGFRCVCDAERVRRS